MTSRITMIDPSNPPLQFQDIEAIYTDLDGSLLAPSGTIFTKHDGTPSVSAPVFLGALKDADIPLVVATGRNRAQVAEISRILNVDTFIGELGGFTQYGFGAKREFFFHKGLWKELPAGKTPVEVMDETKVIDKLCNLYPGYCERIPMNIVNAREVSILVLGQLDIEEAIDAISTDEYPIDIIDNGEVYPAGHHLKIDTGIHVYHILPRGISKGHAVESDILRRGIDPSKTLAIGDSCGDLSMAHICGSFVLVGNGVAAPEVVSEIDKQNLDVFGVEGHSIDGWVEMASALLVAKGR